MVKHTTDDIGKLHISPVVVLIYYIGDLALLRPTRFFD